MSVVVSQGFGRFHLGEAAEAAAGAGQLVSFFTGAYPGHGLIGRLAQTRLRERRVAIPSGRIRSYGVSEAGFGLAQRTGSSVFGRHSRALSLSMRQYSRAAMRELGTQAESLSGRAPWVYHYRAGFGNQSVEKARDLGGICVCDLSLAHPRILKRALELPNSEWGVHFWELVEKDVAQSDLVLANSEYVSESVREAVEPQLPVEVIYWGLDQPFEKMIRDEFDINRVPVGAPKLLFAGGIEHRKGADTLAHAVGMTRDVRYQLVIAGPVRQSGRTALRELEHDPRVEYRGRLSRRDLLACMMEADLFVFPSRAEGSARVVFEALGAGLYSIVTRETGSVVGESDSLGCLVPPGSPQALAEAIRRTCEDISSVRASRADRSLDIRDRFGPSSYRQRILDFYQRMSGS